MRTLAWTLNMSYRNNKIYRVGIQHLRILDNQRRGLDGAQIFQTSSQSLSTWNQ